MDLPIEVKLKRPIVIGEMRYDTLSFDEPDLDAQIAYAELEATFSDPRTAIDGARVNRFWIARLADIPESVAGKIKDSDLEATNAAAEAALGFKAGKGNGDALGNETPAK
ncbi:hypothetical protein JI58_08080 [Marinosulfonomonas sp. PRT-SC04]|nr:hypothetical protein JI58_08080 [Marinosulfonomonas sp. PRT-SC04]